LTVGSNYYGVNNQDTGTKFLIDSKGKMYIFWTATPGNDEVWYIEKENNALFWSQIKTAAEETGYDCVALQAAIDSKDRVHIVYTSFADKCIIHKYLNGTTWSDRIQVSHSPYGAGGPSIAIDTDDMLHFTWTDFHNNGNGSISYTRTTWNGTIIINDTFITDNPNAYDCTSKVILDEEQNVYIIYCQEWYREDPYGYNLRFKVLFKKYDANLTLLINETVVAYTNAWASGDANKNQVVCWDNKGRLHLAYQDRKEPLGEMYEEIYHRSSSCSDFAIQTISVEPSYPQPNEPCYIKVNINQTGELQNYALVRVKLNGTIIASENITLNNTSILLQYYWLPSYLGEHLIEITILPYSVRDSNAQNNYFNFTIFVGQAIPEFDFYSPIPILFPLLIIIIFLKKEG
jgi:hypothetical protein